MTSQEISQLKTLPHEILHTLPFLLSMFEIIHKHNLYLNIDLDGKSNSSLNAHFKISNFLLRNQKFKKEKWSCSQNLDLNPTYEQFYRNAIRVIICQWSFP